MGFKFKKGEKVVVIKGKDKKKTGVIEKVLPKENKVVISGLNILTHFVKPNQAHPNGAIVKSPAPINASNVSHLDPRAGIPTRVGYRIEENGVKVKFSRKSKENIVV